MSTIVTSTSPAAPTGTAAIHAGWPSATAVAAVTAELRRRPPLVAYADCAALTGRLARVADGGGHVLQAGDCAELFAEVSAAGTARKIVQLHDLASAVTRATRVPVVRIGRLAGQFAKPRSRATVPGPGGEPLPAYRGDAVNDLVPTPAARTPDPRRMLTAYDRSAEVLGHLAGGPIYTSHEALLCEYEEALARLDPATGVRYGSSAHLLWVGDRSRQVDGPHVDLLARVANPVAVKLGPTATAHDVAALVERLDPDRAPGRLVLVARLGAGAVVDLLPPLVEAARTGGARPVWLCDPMHANTVSTPDGRKTRPVDDVVREVTGFVGVLRAAGVHPGGLHLETSPDDVTECVEARADLPAAAALPRYRTACDPRLNPGQARRVVEAFVREVTR
ncbi:3-deoxy-7-phosphoheptulonate synthase [Planosporangium sp. 12N6]|uniref:3-deoxy-7-phosphoheptulonate synthase n=1 Tax=Planosporangium spinosum TaxID=3402278 RepID=UPI003CE688A3